MIVPDRARLLLALERIARTLSELRAAIVADGAARTLSSRTPRLADRRTIERRAPRRGVTVRIGDDETTDQPKRIRRARYGAQP